MDKPNPGRFDRDPQNSWTLPAHWYYDEEIFSLEKSKIFHRNWWYVGAVNKLSEPGQFITATVVDQDVFIIRDNDGQLRGFYNVCRHRAHRLVSMSGKCRGNLVCPYHGWTYSLDGAFVGARGIDNMKNFDPKDFGLVAVRIETMIGLVFVNLDNDAPRLNDLSSAMLQDMRRHCPNLDNLKLAKTFELETAANWKTLVDNDLESYHAAIAHRSLMGLLDYSSFEVWEDRYTTCHAMTNASSANDAYSVEENDPVKRAIYTWLWPNTAFFIAPGRSNLGVFQMIPTSPETSRQHWDFYFESDDLTVNENSYLDWTIDTLIPEDTVLYENVQRGLRSNAYSSGRFVINSDNPELDERHVHMFQKLVCESIIS